MSAMMQPLGPKKRRRIANQQGWTHQQVLSAWTRGGWPHFVARVEFIPSMAQAAAHWRIKHHGARCNCPWCQQGAAVGIPAAPFSRIEWVNYKTGELVQPP